MIWFASVCIHTRCRRACWTHAQEWSYLRGGLSTLDRDYGIFNKIHHDIGTHVVHHLLPQIPHYHLEEATAAVKPVMGPYYRCLRSCTPADRARSCSAAVLHHHTLYT